MWLLKWNLTLQRIQRFASPSGDFTTYFATKQQWKMRRPRCLVPMACASESVKKKPLIRILQLAAHKSPFPVLTGIHTQWHSELQPQVQGSSIGKLAVVFGIKNNPEMLRRHSFFLKATVVDGSSHTCTCALRGCRDAFGGTAAVSWSLQSPTNPYNSPPIIMLLGLHAVKHFFV